MGTYLVRSDQIAAITVADWSMLCGYVNTVTKRNPIYTYNCTYLPFCRKYVAKNVSFCALNRSVKRFSFLIKVFFFLLRTGTDRHPNICAHRIRNIVRHTGNQRSQTSVPYRLDVHFVSLFDIHSVRVPKEEVVSAWYV